MNMTNHVNINYFKMVIDCCDVFNIFIFYFNKNIKLYFENKKWLI